MSTLNEPKQTLIQEVKIMSKLQTALSKCLHGEGFKWIEFGDDFIKCEGFKLEITIKVKL